jgi:hypothetical protein
MSKDQVWTKEQRVDEIDELIAKAFYETNFKIEGDPLRCYLLLVVLLRKLGQYSPGLSVERIRQRLETYIGSHHLREVEDIAEKIAERIFEIVAAPTYVAASYWSPIDERRHTISYRGALKEGEDERHLLAYAYAFYSLTFLGHAKKYYSATQYTAVEAPRKRGVMVCYQDKPEILDDWWHIPRSSHQTILNDTGLTSMVEEYLLKESVSVKEMRDALRRMLVNAGEAAIEVSSFPSKFIDSFSTTITKISEETREIAIRTRDYINRLFDARLNDEQSLFMLMTNLIYDKAFPSNYLYSFPVRINELCSVMTLGTNQPLDPFAHLSLTRIVTSIFMHPLLLDYATRASDAVKSTSKMLLMGGFAHSANNALRMADIDSLIPLLSSGSPPEHARFSVEDGNVEDALYKLRALWVGGRAAQSFIALVEMITRPGNLREKFTSKRPYTLDECEDEATKMINVHVEGQVGHLPYLRLKRSKRYWVNAQLPTGYLDHVYVYTFLYELLLNVCNYGPTKKKGDKYYAGALISSEFADEQLDIHIRNKISDQKMMWDSKDGIALPWATGTHERSSRSFLQFASAISEHIEGIKITSKVVEENGIKFYDATLSLGPVLVEMKNKKTKRIGPVLLSA